MLVSDEVGQADNSVQVHAADSANPQAIEANGLSGTVHSHYSIPNEEGLMEAKIWQKSAGKSSTPRNQKNHYQKNHSSKEWKRTTACMFPDGMRVTKKSNRKRKKSRKPRS